MRLCERYAAATALNQRLDMPGPTGESNELRYRGRGQVLCLQEPAHAGALLAQLAAAYATGNRAVLVDGPVARAATEQLPPALRQQLRWIHDWSAESFDAVLFAGGDEPAQRVRGLLARRGGARIAVLRELDGAYSLDRLLAEQVITTNTAAAGGNASLMSLQPC